MGDGIVTIFSKENFILRVIPFLLRLFPFLLPNESSPLATVDFFFCKLFMIGITALKLKLPIVEFFIFRDCFSQVVVVCKGSSTSLQKVCKFSAGHLM